MSLCVYLSPDTNRVIETVRSNWSIASLQDIIGIYDVLNVSFVPASLDLIQQLERQQAAELMIARHHLRPPLTCYSLYYLGRHL